MRARRKRILLREFEDEVMDISRLIVQTEAGFLLYVVKPKIISLIKRHKRYVDYARVRYAAAELQCKMLNKVHSKK